MRKVGGYLALHRKPLKHSTMWRRHNLTSYLRKSHMRSRAVSWGTDPSLRSAVSFTATVT